jgi:hypothetical protein
VIFTDRSRQTSETQECARRRYWAYHGVNGYGIRRIGSALEMETGLAVHAILANILQSITLGGWKMPDLKLNGPARVQIRGFIKDAQDIYRKKVATEGWLKRNLDPAVTPEVANRWLNEQCALVEGLTWAWVKAALPIVIAGYTPVAIEGEETLVLSCTCTLEGKQKNNWKAHFDLGCRGVVQMARPDILLRDRRTGKVGNHDFKTVAYLPDDDKIEEYKNNIQMMVGTLAAEARIKEPITHYVVHFLQRGMRKSTYTKGSEQGVFDGARIQYSHFCYVTYQESSPPIKKEKISIVGTWYTKTPVWEIEFEGKPDYMGNVEWLVEKLGGEITGATFAMVGPFDRPTRQAKGYIRQVEENEKRWAARQWQIYEDVKDGMPLDEALDRNLPPSSWQCTQYKSKCPFYEICHGEVDPARVLESGLYEFREPHHEAELIAQRIWMKQELGLDVEVPEQSEVVNYEAELKKLGITVVPVQAVVKTKSGKVVPFAAPAPERKV